MKRFLEQVLNFILYPFRWLWRKVKPPKLPEEPLKEEPPAPAPPILLNPAPPIATLCVPAGFNEAQLVQFQNLFQEKTDFKDKAELLNQFLEAQPPIEVFVRLHEDSGTPMIGFRTNPSSPLGTQVIQFLEKLAQSVGFEITSPAENLLHVFVRKYMEEEHPDYIGHRGYDFLEIFKTYPGFLSLLDESSVRTILGNAESRMLLSIDGHDQTLEALLEMRNNSNRTPTF